MRTLELSSDEAAQVDLLLDRLVAEYLAADAPAFLHAAATIADELPLRVRRTLREFRLHEHDGACLLRGYNVDDDAIGPTPERWTGVGGRPVRESMLLVLYTALIGDVFGWRTQQDGALLHDVLPVREHEDLQIGTGSRELITWHTEDAAYECRGDYVALLCLRNPGGVPTTLAEMIDIELPRGVAQILRQPRFAIDVDHSHRMTADVAAQGAARVRVPVLFGDPAEPYLRADPYFMPPSEGDQEAAEAFQTLVKSVDAALREAVLRPGDCLIVDNFRAVHGRMPFVPSYDGRDRWLKRVNVTRDLRKSRGLRASPQDRVVEHAQ